MIVPSLTKAAEAGQRSEGGVRPDTFIGGDDHRIALALLDGDGCHFLVKHSRSRRLAAARLCN